MKTFKEFTENHKYDNLTVEQIEQILAESPNEAGEIMSRVIIELQELIWKLMKLMYNIVKFLIKLGVSSGTFLYRRYNKQARDDRSFDKQMQRTNKEIKKLKMAKARYENAIMRLDSMKDALDNVSKEDQLKHKKEIQAYKKGIKEIEFEAKNALKKLEAIKIAPGTPRFGMFG